MLNLPLKSICSGLTCWTCSAVCGVCLAWAILFSPYPAVLRWGLLGRWEHEPLARAHRHERVLHRVLDFVWRPTFQDPALWRTTRLLSDQKGCRVRFLWEVGRFPMEKTFYLVLDWQTWWVSWCWEYASGHLKSVCVWSTNKLLEKLCCGSASWDVTLSQTWQSVPLDFSFAWWGWGCAAFLGLGAVAASSCSGLLQPELESPCPCCWSRSSCGCGWGGSGLALWSSLRISSCYFFEEEAVVVSPKQVNTRFK